jgi:hypothetical protein
MLYQNVIDRRVPSSYWYAANPPTPVAAKLARNAVRNIVGLDENLKGN